MPNMSTFLCNPSEAQLNNMEVFMPVVWFICRQTRTSSFIKKKKKKTIRFNTKSKLSAFGAAVTEESAQELYVKMSFLALFTFSS